jgi:histidinol-phosphate aminotransferase
MNTNRREWLKTTTAVLAGMGIAPQLLAGETKKYLPGGIILLNSNENAYGPSPASRKAMSEALAYSNRYPDEQLPQLKQQLADFWGVGKENVLMGAGSSEILVLTCMLVSSARGNIITAEPSYRVWNSQAETFGQQFIRIPLDNEKKLDLEKMMNAVDGNTRMMYVCNPNNPTGTYIENARLRDFVSECSKKCMVLVDEAYTEFADLPSLKDLAIQNPNIVVAKTFSKIYGLAGARIGYAIAQADTIKKLSGYQAWPDISVSMVTAAAAAAALNDQAFVKDCREKTAKAREICYSCFKELKLDYIPSHTSFIMFNIDKIPGDLSTQMLTKNIFVQYRAHFSSKWCRVSMGTIDEMQQFCAALKSIAG